MGEELEEELVGITHGPPDLHYRTGSGRLFASLQGPGTKLGTKRLPSWEPSASGGPPEAILVQILTEYVVNSMVRTSFFNTVGGIMFERKLGFKPSFRVKLELQNDLDFELGIQTLPELPLHFFSG